MANFRQVGIDRSVLRTACANLWKTYRYNQHYIGFLTGGVSQEDYEAAVEKYAAEPSSLHDELLRSAPRILSEILDDDDLDCHDLAVILNVSAEQLELALDKGESA